jgi:hypothetical protein
LIDGTAGVLIQIHHCWQFINLEMAIISSLPVLANVPINNGITVADYVDQSTVTEGIGPLSTHKCRL